MELDRGRFEIIVKEQRGKLLVYLMAVRGADRNDAEDAIQDACASTLEHAQRHGWQSIEHPKTWLLTVVRNAHVTAMNRKNRFPILKNPWPSDEPADPRNDVPLLDITVDVHAALRGHPRDQAEVMYLDLLEFSKSEIEAALDLDTNMVRRLVAAGRKRLKQELKHHKEGGGE